MASKSGRAHNKPSKSKAPVVERTLRISELGRHCDGIGSEEGSDSDPSRYFTPYTLPGELVRARTSAKNADLIEVLEPSLDRVTPECPLFGTCGGCAAQHMDAGLYRSWKRGVVETALRNRDIDVGVDELIDAHGSGRRRVTFHVQFVKGQARVGFMRTRSRELIEVETCPILAPSLSGAVEAARALAAPFSKAAQQIDIAITATPDGLDCDIRGGGEADYDTHTKLAELADLYDLARVSMDAVVALERRKPMMRFGTLRAPLPTACFLQATDSGEETLVKLVLAEIGDAKKVADLFCGVGPFALRFAPFAAVYAADSNADAIKALSDAVRLGQGLKPVEAVTRDLFRNPVYRDDLEKFDAVIFNPARSGAEAQALEIAQSAVPVVVCVSCDPASLARDADILVSGGYTFERAMPVDQFKYAAHVETVAVFRRK